MNETILADCSIEKTAEVLSGRAMQKYDWVRELNEEFVRAAYQTYLAVTYGSNDCVYFLRSGTLGLTKIGATKHIGQRVRQIAGGFSHLIGNSGELELVAYYYTPYEVDLYALEAYFHELFGDKRKYGEWFDISNDEIVSRWGDWREVIRKEFEFPFAKKTLFDISDPAEHADVFKSIFEPCIPEPSIAQRDVADFIQHGLGIRENRGCFLNPYFIPKWMRFVSFLALYYPFVCRNVLGHIGNNERVIDRLAVSIGDNRPLTMPDHELIGLMLMETVPPTNISPEEGYRPIDIWETCGSLTSSSLLDRIYGRHMVAS